MRENTEVVPKPGWQLRGREGDVNGVGQKGCGGRGWGEWGDRAEGRDIALFLFHFGLLLPSILDSLAQIFSWHLWLIFSISVSLYPSVSCLSLSLHCLSDAIRHCGDNGWGTWAPTIRVDIHV